METLVFAALSFSAANIFKMVLEGHRKWYLAPKTCTVYIIICRKDPPMS